MSAVTRSSEASELRESPRDSLRILLLELEVWESGSVVLQALCDGRRLCLEILLLR